ALQHSLLRGTRAREFAEGRHRGRQPDGGAAGSVVAARRYLFGRLPHTRTCDGAKGARALRRPRGRSLRLVRPEYAREGVRLSGRRRRFRNRDGLGGGGSPAPGTHLLTT